MRSQRGACACGATRGGELVFLDVLLGCGDGDNQTSLDQRFKAVRENVFAIPRQLAGIHLIDLDHDRHPRDFRIRVGRFISMKGLECPRLWLTTNHFILWLLRGMSRRRLCPLAGLGLTLRKSQFLHEFFPGKAGKHSQEIRFLPVDGRNACVR